MTELQTKIEELKLARAAIARLEDLQATKAADVERGRAELTQIRETMGADILAAELSGGAGAGAKVQAAIAGKLATIGARIESTEAVIKELDARIVEAKAAERVAQGNCLRAHAAELRKEAQTRQVKTDSLLAQLKEYEGVAYVPDPTPVVIPGTVGRFTNMPETVEIHTSRTQKLMSLAAGYEADARAIEAGQPIPWSLVTGQHVAPLPDYLK